jgi:hypothetical protein
MLAGTVRRFIAVAAMAAGSLAMLGFSPAQAASSPVVIHEIFYNSPGSDHGSNSSLNAEWVQLRNRTGHQVTLANWTLRDASNHVYKFGTYRLKAHGSVKIHTGKGGNTQASRYWGHSWYIWNNDKDTATLKNAGGTVMSRCSYNNKSRSSKTC